MRAARVATMGNFLTSGPASATLATALATVAVLILAAQHWRLRGTTLIAPWAWAMLAISAIGAVEALVRLHADVAEPAWARPLRFVVAVTSFCPLMALLGAKRPQDRAWQFIVLSLWLVLALPGIEWLLMGVSRAQELHPARVAFLITLAMIGALNVLPTRFWPAGLLCLAAQAALLGPYVPLGAPVTATTGPLWGLALALAAISLVSAGVPRRPRVSHALDRAWLDFRDAWGTAWALRVIQRVNASSSMYGWNVVLAWHGFQSVDGAPLEHADPRIVVAVGDMLKTPLRRFVSPDWISQRLDQPLQ